MAVRDLWNGEPVAHLALRFVTRAGSIDVTSNGSGSFNWPDVSADAVDRVEAVESRYTVVSVPADIAERSEIWCFEQRTVSGRVVFAGESGSFDKVSLSFSPPRFTPEGSTAGVAGRYKSLRRHPHGKAAMKVLHGVDGDGRFRFDVPRIRRAAVVARAPGWLPAWEDLDDAVSQPRAELVLVLRPGIRIEGTLRDEHDRPLPGARILVFVVRRSTYDQMDQSSVGRIKASGYTVARSEGKNWSRVKLSYRATVDEQGRWSVDVDGDGDVFVVSYPSGKGPVERRMGSTSALSGVVDLVARPASRQRVRIKDGGKWAANSTYRVIDLSLIEAKPSFNVRTDGAGQIVSEHWLMPGKRYAITSMRARAVFFRYVGQAVLDFAQCETDFDRFIGDK